MVKLKHLIFDVSGTIWNDKMQVFEANSIVLHNAGFKNFPKTHPNKEAIGKDVTPESLMTYNAVGSCSEAFGRFKMRGTEEEFEQLYVDALDPASEIYPVKPYEGIVDMLFNLKDKGVKLSIVSSHPQHRLDLDLTDLGVYDLFDEVKGSTHNKAKDILIHARMNGQTIAPFYNTGYIGDTVSDMKAANKAQVVPIGVSYGYQPKSQVMKGKPQYLFNSVSNLEEFLLENN